jgi:hypothetical protein
VEQAPDTLRLWCSYLISHNYVTFWPKCTTCGRPWECLLFIECARGAVELGTHGNVCRGYPNNTNLERLELLAIYTSQRRKYGHTQSDRRGPRLARGRGVCGGVGRSRLRLSDCMMAPRVKDAGQRRHSHTPTHAGTHTYTEDLSNNSCASHLV